MKDRKLQVIHLSHELFIEKGFQATSIQDILTYTGISKGTFYNYFSSKTELLIAIFKESYKQMEEQREALMVGKSPKCIEIFTQQIKQQMIFNHKHQLVSLFDEMVVLDDPELKAFIKKGQLRLIRWIYHRFIEIFGDNQKPYLLDMSIVFLGILHQLSKYYTELYPSSLSINKVVQYSVDRIVEMTNDVSTKNVQIFSPSLIDSEANGNQSQQEEIKQLCEELLSNDGLTNDEVQLLQFIEDELLYRKKPRQFLIKSAMETLQRAESIANKDNLNKLQAIMVSSFPPSFHS